MHDKHEMWHEAALSPDHAHSAAHLVHTCFRAAIQVVWDVLQLSSDASTDGDIMEAGVRIGDVYALLVGEYAQLIDHDGCFHCLQEHTLKPFDLAYQVSIVADNGSCQQLSCDTLQLVRCAGFPAAG